MSSFLHLMKDKSNIDHLEGFKILVVLQATAALFNLLGLPEHYAMELFVEYKP